MYIGKAAQLSGTTVKCIRHYEKIGLMPEPVREGKYRIYSQQSVELLSFIKCAQQLGFKLKEMQAIFQDYRGEEIPWGLAQQAIADKSANCAPRSTRCKACMMAWWSLKPAFRTPVRNAASS